MVRGLLEGTGVAWGGVLRVAITLNLQFPPTGSQLTRSIYSYTVYTHRIRTSPYVSMEQHIIFSIRNELSHKQVIQFLLMLIYV